MFTLSSRMMPLNQNLKPVTRPGRSSILLIVAMVLLLVGAVAIVYVAVRPSSVAGDVKAKSTKPGGLDEALTSVAALKREGAFEKAKTVLDGIIAQHPSEQQPYVELAEVLVAMDKPVEAYANYERAFASGPASANLHLAAGSVASMSGKLDRAEEHFLSAQQLNTSDYKAPLFLAQVQVKLGSTAKIEEAKKNLILAATLRPQTAAAWGTLAELALRENKVTIAMQHIAKAREHEPAAMVWRLLEARILKRDNKPEQAVALLNALDPADRGDALVLKTLAECYGMLQQPLEAAKAYALASDAEPARGDIALEAARWFIKGGDKSAAQRYAQRALDAGEEGAAELIN